MSNQISPGFYRFRWVFLLAGLLLLTAGVAWLFGFDLGWGYWNIESAGLLGVMGNANGPRNMMLPRYSLEIGCGYLGIFFITQWLFLRPRRQWVVSLVSVGRPMKRAVFGASLMAALLTIGALVTLLELPGWWQELLESDWWKLSQFVPSAFWPGLVALAIAWLIWSVIFYIYWRRGDRYTQLHRMTQGLIAGSILNFMVSLAVQIATGPANNQPVNPSKGEDCYCARGSYTGLVFAGTVLLWAFGPGIVLLFARERYRKSLLMRLCPKCSYDLRGTVDAGRASCPECGEAVPEAMRNPG